MIRFFMTSLLLCFATVTTAQAASDQDVRALALSMQKGQTTLNSDISELTLSSAENGFIAQDAVAPVMQEQQLTTIQPLTGVEETPMEIAVCVCGAQPVDPIPLELFVE